MGMKQILVIMMAVVLVGCGKKHDGNTGVVNPNKPSPKAAPEKLITDPIVEKAIRLEINKPEGELTKADFERVTVLFLINTQLTNANSLVGLTQLDTLLLQKNTELTDISALARFTKLTSLTLLDNPNLTKAQIEKLQKALQKCAIEHNTTK